MSYYSTLWVLLLLSFSIKSDSWFFSSGKGDSSETPSELSEFSTEPFNSREEAALLEKAKEKAALPNSCWQDAYQNLFAVCAKTLADEEQRSRLAWYLTDCFQKDIGMSPFPCCDVKSRMKDCLKRVDQEARSHYLEFYLETDTICHQLQTDAFKRQTEKLVDELKEKAALPNSCWQNAYQNLFAVCAKILADDEQRSRLAWYLTDCFQKDIGKSPFPYCDANSRMKDCLKRVDQEAHSHYLEFYLETNTICHQLQTNALKRQTERLVHELKRSAESADDKLESIEEQVDSFI